VGALGVGDAGVVDQDIDGAERLFRLADHGQQLVGVGDVERQGDSATAGVVDLLCKGFQPVNPAGGQGDGAALRGQHLGKVSADFGGNATTIHLHFEIKAPVADGGGAVVMFVPTYSSLVDSYGRLLNGAA
jgi:hypothetical protein